MTDPILLGEDQLGRLADLVAERIIKQLTTRTSDDQTLVTARDIADMYGVTRSWCYEHADELEAIRIGAGSRPRLRFKPETVERHLSRLREPSPPPAIAAPRRSGRQLAGRTISGAPLLAIKDAA